MYSRARGSFASLTGASSNLIPMLPGEVVVAVGEGPVVAPNAIAGAPTCTTIETQDGGQEPRKYSLPA